MFKAKARPSGFEFGACEACNFGTRGADAAVAFLARIEQQGQGVDDWQLQEGVKYLHGAASIVPGFVEEFFDTRRAEQTHLQTKGGILVPVFATRVGPIAKALLNTWSAKLGMALYREHIGEPLPLDGGVHCQWFLNAGLGEQTAHAMLSILPAHNTLKQGERKSVTGQFDYRFNSDDKSIVAALAHFHTNLHVFVIAMAEPATYGFPSNVVRESTFARPGEVLGLMPKPPPLVFMPGKSDKPLSDFLILPR